MDPIGKLMGLRYKSHPWHGIDIGEEAPGIVTTFIDEVDKASGYLKIDRPQKYSNVIPALYGFIPQTYSGKSLAEYTMEKTAYTDIVGDGDPLDVCVLTLNSIPHGDILVQAIPIGGFRMLDGKESDDKIIAVLKNDAVYGNMKDITACPEVVIDRLKHYFLTYKDLPGEKRNVEITHVFGVEEAHEVIRRSMEDYKDRFQSIGLFLKGV
jgi:inorganic pyrophosphatase